MDVQSIVMAAAATMGNALVGEATKKAVSATFEALKAAIAKRRGPQSEEVAAVAQLAQLPPNTPPEPRLVQQVEALRADPEVAEALARIEALLKEGAPEAVKQQYNFYGTFNNLTFN